MSALADLLGALTAAPALPGARCVGNSEVFDPAPIGTTPVAEAEHTSAAVAICSSCPALTACRAWLDGLTPPARPLGVVAGRVSTPGPRPRRKARPDLHAAVHAALRAEPYLTDKEHARTVGCSDTTVTSVRRALETAGQIPRVRRKGGPRQNRQQKVEIA
ncbi:MAG: hypothetical protein ACRDUB_20705 [Mycobacterium sp.]